MKKLLFYLTAVGAAFFACNKAKPNEPSASIINPALSVSSYDFQNDGGLTQALAYIEALPQQERTRFTDVGREFVADFIYSFDIVYDKAQNKYAVENIKKMYFITEDETLMNHAVTHLNISGANVADRWFNAIALIAEKSAEQNRNGNQKGKIYVIECIGGKHDGKQTTVVGKLGMGNAVEECTLGGGCAKVCILKAFAIPSALLDKYGDFTAEPKKLENILQEVTDANHNSITLEDVRGLEADHAQSKVEYAVVTEE